MRKPTARRALSIVGGVVAGAAVVTYLALLLTQHPAVLDRGDKLASVGGLLLGFAVALGTWWAGRRPPVFEQQRLLADAEKELACCVSRHWDREAVVRGLVEPAPLQTRWASSDQASAAPAAEVLGPAWTAGRPTRLKLHGNVDSVADTLRCLPAHQLVLIGPPGSGKTSAAVILVRRLLRTAAPDEPVPVLLSLTTWRPDEQSLESWLETMVARLYPAVGDAGRFGAEPVVRLLRADRILPILDGLDEMPSGSRGRAISALNNYLTRPRPVVLTCRSEEYRQVIRQVGSPLARAAVVELAEITGIEAAEYLPAGQGVDGLRRWATLVGHLRACPDGVLARTLSTPLMVYLARTAYRTVSSSPTRLLSFSSTSAVEQHLLAAFVPAVYEQGSERGTESRYGPAESQKWLTFLARHMVSTGGREIAWWRLIDAVPRFEALALNMIAAVFLITTVVFSVVTLDSTLSHGVFAAMMAGLFAGIPIGLGGAFAEGIPHRVKIAPRKLFHGFAVGAAMALVALPLSVLLGFSKAGDTVTRVGSSIVAQSAFSVCLGLLVGAVVMLAEGISEPDSEDHLADPRCLLRRDRQTLLVSAVAAGLISALLVYAGCAVVGLFLGGHALATGDALDVSIIFGVILGLAISLASGFGSAWIRLQYARIWLTPRGSIPWRVVDFLDDAHRRGVLRRIGPEYQFRHARLQDFLALNQ